MTIALLVKLGTQVLASPYDVGYAQDTQARRWSWLNKKSKAMVTGKTEADCSSLVAGLVWLAGYNIDISGTVFTGNLAALLKAAGWKIVKFTGLSQCKAGRILLTPYAHTVVCLDSTYVLSAERNELGKATGGKPGDQDGKEVVKRKKYLRSGGWTYVAIPPDESDTNVVTIPAFPLKKGYYFGPKEGPKESVSGYDHKRSNGKKGHDGLAVAQDKAKTLGYYSDTVDGLYGPNSKQMVLDIQKAANKLGAGLVVDAELGAKTWPWIWKVGKKVTPTPVEPTVPEPKVKIKMTRAENIAKYGSKAVEIPIETYLAGVVASEIGESSPVEALRAQAIAARTYAMRYVRAGGTIDDTTKYQAYRVSVASKSPRSVAAIKDTRGQVITYGGSLIQAVYSSSNQGRSTSSKERWGNEFAYLIAQDDPWDTAWRKEHGKATKAHGVGMSQVGAMWAGANGIGYQAILKFYYPGTKLTTNYNL